MVKYGRRCNSGCYFLTIKQDYLYFLRTVISLKSKSNYSLAITIQDIIVSLYFLRPSKYVKYIYWQVMKIVWSLVENEDYLFILNLVTVIKE